MMGQTDIESWHARIRLEQERRAAEMAENGLIMSLGNSRLSRLEMNRLQRMFDSDTPTRKEVAELRRKAVSGPRDIPDVVASAMQTVVLPPETLPRQAAWLSPLCNARHEFRGSVIGFYGDAGYEWFYYLYAMKTPLVLSVTPLRQIDLPPIRSDVTVAESLVVAKRLTYAFEFDITHRMQDEDLKFKDDVEVVLIPHAVLLAGGMLGTYTQPLLLRDVAKPGKARGEQGRRPSSARSADAAAKRAAFLLEHPWGCRVPDSRWRCGVAG